MNGGVIGIVSHNISKSGGSEGLGFVVTMNTAKKLLLEKRSFWGGLEGQILSDDLADLLNLPAGSGGYLIKNVAKGSPPMKRASAGARHPPPSAVNRSCSVETFSCRPKASPSDPSPISPGSGISWPSGRRAVRSR